VDEQMTGNKAVADAYYQAGVRGDLPASGDYLDENFIVTAPNYLPWGGTHRGAAFFMELAARPPRRRTHPLPHCARGQSSTEP
jgi:hypothetical protein